MSIDEKYEYEVALSFAGEQRDYVAQVAKALRSNGVRFYYDVFDEIELWGKFMPDRFQEVMGDKSKYAVIFISKEYKEKFYTNLERMTLLTSDLFKEGRLLPVKFDVTKLPGLPDGIKYISLNNLMPYELAEKIIQKIGKKIEKNKRTPHDDFYIPKQRKSINPITERKAWIKYLIDELKQRSQKVEGLEMDDDDEGSHHKFLFQYNGEVLLSIRIIKGGIGNDNGLSFGFDHGYSSDSGINAWGDFKLDTERDEVLLNTNGMGFNMEDGMYTKKDLVNTLWKKVTDQIDEENKK